jgi:hypothetical protein
MAKVSQYPFDNTPTAEDLIPIVQDPSGTPITRVTDSTRLARFAFPQFGGDSGSGGSKGVVPAPGIGDSVRFLRGDGTWSAVSGVSSSAGGSHTQLQYNYSGALSGTNIHYVNNKYGFNTTIPSGQIHQVVPSGIVGHRIDLTNSHGANAFEINGSGIGGGERFLVTEQGWVGIRCIPSSPLRVKPQYGGFSVKYVDSTIYSVLDLSPNDDLSQSYIIGNSANRMLFGTSTEMVFISPLYRYAGEAIFTGFQGGRPLWIDYTNEKAKTHVGLSSIYASIGGRVYTTTVPSGNIGTGEDNITDITAIGANAFLSTGGKAIKVKAWGSTANNVNSKTLKIYANTTNIFTGNLTVSTLGTWIVEVDIMRHGTHSQKYMCELREAGAVSEMAMGSLSLHEGSGITIKLTGEATSNNDIICEGVYEDFLN